MRQLFCIFVALLCSTASAGVRRWSDNTNAGKVDPKASAALFVGVRDFDDESLTPVPYAVDDAVDLAYELTIDSSAPILEPNRVILAISGDPQKEQTKDKLKVLLAAGALKYDAGMSNILKFLDSQSRAVGSGGMLFVSFATHGISKDGIQYLLTENSLLKFLEETSLTDVRIRDIVAQSGVPRSLILIDACRERISSDRRDPGADPRSVAAFIRALRSINGQVVISAAAPGCYAYDDESRQNGVFTATVIDGLRCQAGKNSDGYVTADTLYSYVSKSVLAWLREHKNPDAKKATQVQFEGESRQMPLSMCVSHTVSASSPRPQ